MNTVSKAFALSRQPEVAENNLLFHVDPLVKFDSLNRDRGKNDSDTSQRLFSIDYFENRSKFQTLYSDKVKAFKLLS